MAVANECIRLTAPDGRLYEIGNDKPLTILAGPCAMESREHALETAFML